MSTNTVSTNAYDNTNTITTKPADNDPCLSPKLRFYSTDARTKYMEAVQKNPQNMKKLLTHLLVDKGSPDNKRVARSKWMKEDKYIYFNKVHLFECWPDHKNDSGRLLYYYKHPADSGIESGLFRSGLFLVFEVSLFHKLVGFKDHPRKFGEKEMWYGVEGEPTEESSSVYSPRPEEKSQKSKSKKKK